MEHPQAPVPEVVERVRSRVQGPRLRASEGHGKRVDGEVAAQQVARQIGPLHLGQGPGVGVGLGAGPSQVVRVVAEHDG